MLLPSFQSLVRLYLEWQLHKSLQSCRRETYGPLQTDPKSVAG